MTARDIHYGRRGGRWVDHEPGALVAELAAMREAAGGDLRAKPDDDQADDDDQLALFE